MISEEGRLRNNGAGGGLLRAREFAGLAGVTVRALHHYDRMGLLKPRRTEAGYRLYRAGDLERLEQIVALKSLGIPLKQIGTLLQPDAPPLLDALRAQRRVLEQKRRLLDGAIEAIRRAEAVLEQGGCPGAELLKEIIEAIGMQENNDWMWKYQTEEAKAKIQSRQTPWSPELQERVSRQWKELIAEVRGALGNDRAGEAVQAPAARWMALVEEFTGGDPEIAAGVRRLYAGHANWPEYAMEQMRTYLDREVWDFIHQAIALRKT